MTLALLLAGLTVFEADRVIVSDGSVVADAVLVVRDGVIESVAPKGTSSFPRDASRVSLAGKTVMPLLIDIHGHIGYLKDGVFAASHYGTENILDHLRMLESFGVGAFLSHKAGIPIALGGDTGIPTRFVGYNEHLELQALVDAGLSPLEAITAGTKVGAEILGLDDLGTLSPWKSADFLVLDASPLENVANTTKIGAVYRKGQPLTLPTPSW